MQAAAYEAACRRMRVSLLALLVQSTNTDAEEGRHAGCRVRSGVQAHASQFTRFTGAEVQILTQKESDMQAATYAEACMLTYDEVC
jgi:hypothetical protein